MRLFRRDEKATANRGEIALQYMRSLPPKEYEKMVKIIEIYRKADEDAKVVTLGSKKAVREQEKENHELNEIDVIGVSLEESNNE